MAKGPLACARFQHPRIQEAASVPGKSIKTGEPPGYPVAAVQYSLHQLKFPLPKSMAGGKPDGRFGDETKQAIWLFQKDRHIEPADGKAGRRTLAALDADIAALPGQGGPVPATPGGGTAPPPPAPTPTPPAVPALPAPLLKTLRRCYDEKTAGNDFLMDSMGKSPGAKTSANMTFAEALAGLVPGRRLESIQFVYNWQAKYGGLWDYVHAIRNSWWTSSIGFCFYCKDPRGLDSYLRYRDKFCADLGPAQSMHQKNEDGQNRQCYRELVTPGTQGLHICVVVAGQETAAGGIHNFHIDLHQIARLKTKKCSCWYANLYSHFSDVGPWIADQAMLYIDARLAANHLPPMPPALRSTIRSWILSQILSSSDFFDVLESGAIKPVPPPSLTSDPAGFLIVPAMNAALKEFKNWYLNNL